MYEPYGEKSRLPKLNLKERFEKIKEYFKDTQVNKFTALAVVLILIAVSSVGYTSYMVYVDRVSQTTSQLVALQEEYGVCQDNLDDCDSLKNDMTTLYNTCKGDLNKSHSTVASLKSENIECSGGLDMCQSSLGATEVDLLNCEGRREELRLGLEDVALDLTECYTDLNITRLNLKTSDMRFDGLVCKYAKEVCRNRDYYYVDSDENLVCCMSDVANTCDVEPEGGEAIREIVC